MRAAPQLNVPPRTPSRTPRQASRPAQALWSATFGLTLIASVGCSDTAVEGAGTSWTVQRDTLPDGVERVVNVPPEGGGTAGWTLVEELRIGRMEGEGPDVFGELKGLVVTPDSLVAVLEAQAQEVRIFTHDGTHRITHGRQGEGPGEFSQANGLMLTPGGDLWVPDHGNARMTALDPLEGYLKSEPVPVMSFGYTYLGAMLSDGRVVKPSGSGGGGFERMLRIFGPEMTTIDSIFIPESPRTTDRDDPPTSFAFTTPTGGGFMGVPFIQRGVSHFHPGGRVWSSAALSDSHRLYRSTLDFDTTLVVETRRAAVPIPATTRDSAISQLQDRLEDMNADIGNQSWDKVPTQYPFVQRIFSDDLGDIWVEAGTATGSSWDVYNQEGVHLRTVQSELTFVPWTDPVVRGDELWGVVIDEFDIPYVVRARITPTDSEAR